MSVSALTWAFAQEIRPATHKFVLVALADYANEDLEAYPSIAALEKKTCVERRGIFRALVDLKTQGFIEPTGERKGATKQVHVYRLKGCQIGTSLRKGDKLGTVTDLTLKGDKEVPLKGCQNGNTEPSVLFNRQEPSVPPLTPPVEGNGQSNGDEGFCLEATPREKKPKRKSRTVPSQPSEEFRTFFDSYPRGEDMKKAWAAWYRSEETRPPLDEILEAIRKAKKTDGWRRGFIPLAATWINGERWDDDLKIR